jgi:hypothetical protein
MNKSLIFMFVAVVVIVAGVWYWSTRQSDDVAVQLPTPQPSGEVSATRVYKDDVIGFSITFPIALSSTTNDSLYRVETLSEYADKGPDALIAGVKFTIPRVVTTGTNLSADSYLSVEHLAKGQSCDAIAFIGVSNVKSQTIREGVSTYSFASTSEAAAGNRYEEYVYALSGSNPCIAVRYLVHYGAIENYDASTTKAFNRAKLFADFDAIRRTLTINQ